MTEEITGGPETSIMCGFREVLEALSRPPEQIKPIRPEEVSAAIEDLVGALSLRGAILNFDEPAKTEVIRSLGKPKFRDLKTGRGPGVVAVLGKRAEELFEWAQQTAARAGGPRIGFRLGTEGRGLRQAAADILRLAVMAANKPQELKEAIEEFCLRTNQRVWKGLRWALKDKPAEEIDRIDKIFREAGVPEPPRTLASVPPGSLPELWDFLCGSV